MRRSLLPAAIAAAVLSSIPSASAAGACVATADTPSTAGAGVLGSGSFVCDGPRAGMTVTVCIESAPVFLPVLWTVENCTTRTLSSASSVSENVFACVQTPTPVLVRTTADGSNAADEHATAVSAPNWAPGFGSCGP